MKLRAKRLKLRNRREEILVKNALYCQAIQLETNSKRYGNDTGDGLLAAWDMRAIAKRL